MVCGNTKSKRPSEGMSNLEVRAAVRLAACRMRGDSFERRFSREARRKARAGHALTGKERAVLWKLVWRFRAQIRQAGDPAVVETAREIAAPVPPMFAERW